MRQQHQQACPLAPARPTLTKRRRRNENEFLSSLHYSPPNISHLLPSEISMQKLVIKKIPQQQQLRLSDVSWRSTYVLNRTEKSRFLLAFLRALGFLISLNSIVSQNTVCLKLTDCDWTCEWNVWWGDYGLYQFQKVRFVLWRCCYAYAYSMVLICSRRSIWFQCEPFSHYGLAWLDFFLMSPLLL